MTNATSNSKGQENLIPHYMHSSDGCIWGWVRSWAINLCSRAGCHTHSLSWSFPGKQLLWAPGMVGEFPLQPPSTAGAVCPNSRATPSTHRWPLGEFWGDGNGGRHFKALTKTFHTSHARGALSPSPFMEPSPDPGPSTPVTPHCQRNWLKKRNHTKTRNFNLF